ncbi:hypothetical protein B0J14DRAFT_580100 [Halenospora varia]|nr:hypothetical protein B0J14DRAFT_580100 [Halenospora varia]
MQSFGVRNRGEGRAGRTSGELEGSDSGSTPAPIPSTEEDSASVPEDGETSQPTVLWRNFIAKLLFFRQSEREKKEYNARQGYNKFVYDYAHDVPEGFPRLAAWLHSNDNWNIYRGFGSLSARVLVNLEIELTKLEQKILDLDKADEAHPRLKFRLNGYENFAEYNEEQKKNVQKAQKLLSEYFDFLLKYCQVRELDRPTKRNFYGFYNWMWSQGPLCKDKREFMYHIDDFVSAYKHSEKSTRLGDFMERRLDKWPCLRWLFQTDRDRKKSKNKYVIHYSTYHLKTFAKVVTVCISLAILLLPVMLLFLIPMSRASMAWLVFGFVMLFSMVVSSIADAKTHEVLIGTAAYAAVLVTFLGNLK